MCLFNVENCVDLPVDNLASPYMMATPHFDIAFVRLTKEKPDCTTGNAVNLDMN